MIRLLQAIAEDLEERAAIEQALDPRKAQYAAGMREAARVVRLNAGKERSDGKEA